MKIAIVDLGRIVSGDWRNPFAAGDIAAIGAVITDGIPRFVGRSRNTPATTRKARVVRSRVTQDFAAVAH